MTTYAEHAQELSNHLSTAQPSLREDASYYEAEHRLKAIGVSTPPEMRSLIAQVGWPRMYLDSIEERLDIEGFRLAGKDSADERMWSWWQANNMDIESSLAHLEAFIYGRSYVTVASPDPQDPTADKDSPQFRVESPTNMYADIDPRTRRVKRAFRFYQDPDLPNEDAGTLYLPGKIVYMTGGLGGWNVKETVNTNVNAVPVVPLVNRARVADRYGCSEIMPELRSLTDAAARTMMNMQATAELMAVPQRLLFGVAQEALQADPENPGSVLEAYFARIITIEDSDASATQFTAAELQNFVNVLQELAKQAATYTGLPPQYLSHNSENPASAEAIRSSESRLVKKCERKSRMFGGAWEEVMRLGMLVKDGSISDEAYRMETLWRDPATPTYAAKADAVAKLYNNGAGVIPLERARIDLGYTSEERKQMREWDKESPTSQLSALMGSGLTSIPGAQQQQPDSGQEDAA